MRPSERRHLLQVQEVDPSEFLKALAEFLERWAEASWFEDYNVQRVGKWIRLQCSDYVVKCAREVALVNLNRFSGANDFGDVGPSQNLDNDVQIRHRTYSTFFSSLIH